LRNKRASSSRAQGVDNSEVAKRCRVMRQTVGKWRSRFLERRLDGLLERAVEFAQRAQALAELRVSLRERMQAGAL